MTDICVCSRSQSSVSVEAAEILNQTILNLSRVYNMLLDSGAVTTTELPPCYTDSPHHYKDPGRAVVSTYSIPAARDGPTKFFVERSKQLQVVVAKLVSQEIKVTIKSAVSMGIPISFFNDPELKAQLMTMKRQYNHIIRAASRKKQKKMSNRQTMIETSSPFQAGTLPRHKPHKQSRRQKILIETGENLYPALASPSTCTNDDTERVFTLDVTGYIFHGDTTTTHPT